MKPLIIFLSLSILMVLPAYAEQIPGEPSGSFYPYVDPILAYYDAIQQRGNTPAEPVLYDDFSISVPQEVECGWIPITGRVPSEGIVTAVVRQFTEFDNNSDRVGWLTITTQNINSNPAHELRGYVEMPCSEEPTEYTVFVKWSKLPHDIDGTLMVSSWSQSVSYEVLVS